MRNSFFLMLSIVLLATVTVTPEVRAGDGRNYQETEAERQRQAAKEQRKQVADEKRRKDKAERLKLEAVQRAKAKETSKRLAEKEVKVNSSRLARVAQEIKAEKKARVDYVIRPKGLNEVILSWTGKLSKESTRVGGKTQPTYVLTTGDGKRVIITKEAIVNHSLTGVDLTLYVGKELTVKGSASARRKGSKLLHYVVSKIESSTLKSSAIYDDLME